MHKIQKLVQEVATARGKYLDTINAVSEVQARWKPDTGVWNLIEITEHLFWAEQGALFGMWKTLNAIREGIGVKTFASVHANMPIEEVIALTWQPKEKVPEMAAPRLGGTLCFWRASLGSLQAVLQSFSDDLTEEDLRMQAHPHPISGPMDFQQRIEFLRFHINRHQGQASELLTQLMTLPNN